VKVLVLAGETPLPPTSGARQRVLYLTRELARVAQVDVVALGPVPDADTEAFSLRGIPHEAGRYTTLATALRRPYMAVKLASPALGELVEQASADTVQAEYPYLVPAALRAAAPVVLNAQNVETEVLASLAQSERHVRRLRWAWESRKTERFERWAAGRVAAVSVPSDHDAAVFERWGAKRVVVVPNGVDTAAVEHRPPLPGAALVYVGHYGYRPNVLAARELAEQILPRVTAEVPEASVRLVGREPGVDLGRLAAPSVEITGEVPDPVAQLHAARAVVVPLRAGGGSRLKVLEALAAGTPVVSTPLGIAGLELEPGAHVLVGETPADLAELAIRVIRDDDLAASLSERGRRLVEERYDWAVAARPLVELHRELAGR
jgi:polysaccharide biosynthesis protein PslH